jgi:hypothetical protein
MKRYIKLITLGFLCVALLAGCASMKSSKKQFTGTDEMLRTRDYAGALQQIEAAKETGYKKKDRAQYYLDAGMLHHYLGNYEQSNQLLTQAEQAIDENFTKSISKAALSLILNDNAMDYAGEDYEDIYLNVFKALNYLELDSFDGAFVEIRRINMKLKNLETKYKKLASGYSQSKDAKKEMKAGTNKFHNSALGRYLSMLIYRVEGKWDDARIDIDMIQEAWQLQAHIYNFGMPDLSTALDASKTRLNVMAFTGRGPDKKARTLYVHTEENVIFIATSKEAPTGNQKLNTLDTIDWPGVNKGYHFKFQLPYMEVQPENIGSVKVVIDGQTAGELKKLESLSNVALETYKVKEPIIYLKTITRAVVKGLLAEKGKKELSEQVGGGLLGNISRLAADVAVDATENADLRVSRFFPANALVGEYQLSPGAHQVKIEYYHKNGNLLITDDRGEVIVTEDGMNFIETFYLY